MQSVTASTWIRNASGTGDGALAALRFLCAGTSGCKLHLRSDGYFGVGGWSASPWRWYVNLANGDMVAGQDITAGRNITAPSGRVYSGGYGCLSAAMGVQDVRMIVRARRADGWGFVNVTWTPGSTIGGGSLWIENSTTTLPGTWRCLGFSGPTWDETQPFGQLALRQRSHEHGHERASKTRATLLAREVDHRAKNLLAMVQAALRLTRAANPAEFVQVLSGRIDALARAHSHCNRTPLG